MKINYKKVLIVFVLGVILLTGCRRKNSVYDNVDSSDPSTLEETKELIEEEMQAMEENKFSVSGETMSKAFEGIGFQVDKEENDVEVAISSSKKYRIEYNKEENRDVTFFDITIYDKKPTENEELMKELDIGIQVIFDNMKISYNSEKIREVLSNLEESNIKDPSIEIDYNDNIILLAQYYDGSAFLQILPNTEN